MTLGSLYKTDVRLKKIINIFITFNKFNYFQKTELTVYKPQLLLLSGTERLIS